MIGGKDANIKIGKDLQEKYMKTILKNRYRNQPNLLQIKEKLLLRTISFHQERAINQPKAGVDELSKQDVLKYSRQIANPKIDQAMIKNAKIAIFGCGGIGTNVLLSLTYSGVQEFKLVDHDIIEWSNLNRQVLYRPEDLGKQKIHVAKSRLKEINPNLNIETCSWKVKYPVSSNVFEMLEGEYPPNINKINEVIAWADVIVNGMDMYGAPYLINDLCVKASKAYVWGGVNHFQGNIFHYNPSLTKKASCFRCIFENNSKLERHPHNRYKTKGGSQIGVNLGTSVCATGNLISELLIHQISGILPTTNNYYIMDFFDYKLHAIQILPNATCPCQQNSFRPQ